MLQSVACVQVVKAAFEEQLLLITAGSRATIRFLPPLNITSAQVDEAVSKLERAIGKVFDVATEFPAVASSDALPTTAAKVPESTAKAAAQTSN